MELTRRGVGALAIVTAAFVTFGGVAWSALSNPSSSQTNAAVAGTLNTPAGLTTAHPDETTTIDGKVNLSWSDTLAINGTITYTLYRQPAATGTVANPPGGSWTALTTQAVVSTTAGAQGICTTAGSLPAVTVTCSYSDPASSALFNDQYTYAVRSAVGGWNATSSPAMALSLPPTSGVDTTAISPTLNAVSSQSTTNVVAVGAGCTEAVTANSGTSWTLSTIASSVCPSGTNLTGVSVIDATHAWAVGSGGLILVCTATCTTAPAWAKLATVTTQNLNAVAAHVNGANYDVWAVGASDTVVYCAATNCSAAAAPFTAVNPTSSGLTGFTFNGVDTFDGKEAWLVGSNGSSGVIADCNSAATCDTAAGWVVLTSPSSPMNAVDAGSATLVYAVGNSGAVYVCTATCNQTTATFAAASGTGTGTTNLAGVYINSNTNGWIVGAGGFIDKCTTCNNTTGTWTQVADATTQDLAAVNGAAAANVWAVGANGNAVSNIANVAAFTAQASGTTNTLNAIDAVSATTVIAVGAACSEDISTTGTTWIPSTITATACPTGTNLTSVSVLDATHGWAVGSGGLILVCTLTCTTTPVWAKLTTEPTTQNLNGVIARANGPNYDVWAVGANDTVVYCAAATCSTAVASFTVINPTALAGDTLTGVGSLDGNEAWLVGASGTAGAFAGCTSTANCDSAAGWSGLSTATAMNAVSALSNNVVYGAGNGGAAEACTNGCNGTSPTFGAVTVTGAGSTNLAGVFIASNTLGWAVGASGFVAACGACNNAAGTWAEPVVTTTQNLNAVGAVANTTTAWAVGANGTIESNLGNVPGFAVQTSGAGSYSLQSADFTKLANPDSSSYALQAAWRTATSLPGSCVASNQSMEVGFSPTIPTGPAVTSVHAVVTFTDSAAPTGAAVQLLVSANSGTTWTAYSLTLPAANTASTQEIAITPTVGTVAVLPAMQLCFQAVGGTGSFSTSLDMIHVDVN